MMVKYYTVSCAKWANGGGVADDKLRTIEECLSYINGLAVDYDEVIIRFAGER